MRSMAITVTKSPIMQKKALKAVITAATGQDIRIWDLGSEQLLSMLAAGGAIQEA